MKTKNMHGQLRMILALTPLFLTSKISAQSWNRDVIVGGDGVSEVGKYIDFHEADSDPGVDFNVRLYAANNALHTNSNFFANALTANSLGTGSIGIGVTVPNAKLDIFGNSPSATNIILSANYDSKYRWRFLTTDRGEAIDLDITASNFNDEQETLLRLSPSWSGRPELRFESDWFVINNGFVGIGTSTPSELLSVNGTIRSKEVKVEASPWPDYVFEEDYPLIPLSELEAFVMENHHLPEVPTEAEVNENGVEVSATLNLLLKKIEELTLYTIEQQKQIEELRNEVKSLKAN